jgi:hypothetical protein
MSGVSIAPYFPFRRIKIINQSVLADASEARIQVKPDKRFQPVCHFVVKKLPVCTAGTSARCGI